MSIVIRNAANLQVIGPPDLAFVRAPVKGDLMIMGNVAHEIVRVVHAWRGQEAVLLVDVSPMVTNIAP